MRLSRARFPDLQPQLAGCSGLVGKEEEAAGQVAALDGLVFQFAWWPGRGISAVRE